MELQHEALHRLAGELRSDEFPTLSCPHCDQLTLSPGRPHWTPDPDVAASQDNDAWEPDWLYGTFDLPLTCRNCARVVRSLGTYRVEFDSRNSNQHMEWIELMTVDLLYPPVALLSIPRHTPDDIQGCIRNAQRGPGCLALPQTCFVRPSSWYSMKGTYRPSRAIDQNAG